MDKDYEMAVDFKDELIPMAIEYYLNVIEHENSEDEDGNEERTSEDKDGKNKSEKGK